MRTIALACAALALQSCAPVAGPPSGPGAGADGSPSKDVDWSQAQTVDVVMMDFAFAPERIVLTQGRAYRLHLENRGSGGHDFSAPDFFQSVALRQGPSAAEIRQNKGAVEVARGAVEDVDLVPLTVGTFPLQCTHLLHALFGMTGEIIVQ